MILRSIPVRRKHTVGLYTLVYNNTVRLRYKLQRYKEKKKKKAKRRKSTVAIGSML